jgi:hypothetical protein
MFVISSSGAQTAGPPPSHVFVEGEELTYNVRYGFIDLGQVRIKTLNREQVQGQTAFKCKGLIDSYSKVPFVDLHAIYESTVDSSAFSRAFSGRSKENDRWNYSRYAFEYDKKHVLMELGSNDTVVAKRETLEVHTPVQDGLSLFFWARDKLFAGKYLTVQAVVMEKLTTTQIAVADRRESVEVDAVDYPVDVVPFEGTADFVGIFGLTGDFKGWFSSDDARVPIMAKMKVIIGSVTIELMQWKRPGWVPPRAKE